MILYCVSKTAEVYIHNVSPDNPWTLSYIMAWFKIIHWHTRHEELMGWLANGIKTDKDILVISITLIW